MPRIAVVGNATHDVIETGLTGSTRPGGTVLYASMALARLGHTVHPIGYAPLRAYLAMRRAGLDSSQVSLALRATKFKNVYENGKREQWARRGAGSFDASLDLEGYDAVLLGSVLGELPEKLDLPDGPVLVDLQGQLRRLGERDLWGWRRVEAADPGPLWPGVTHVRGSLPELSTWLSTEKLEPAASRLRERTGAVAVVTDGPEGAIASDGELHRTRPQTVDVEDPTGAGDVFDAGLIHALAEGEPIDRALEIACRAASSFLATGGGPRPERFPDREALRG